MYGLNSHMVVLLSLLSDWKYPTPFLLATPVVVRATSTHQYSMIRADLPTDHMHIHHFKAYSWFQRSWRLLWSTQTRCHPRSRRSPLLLDHSIGLHARNGIVVTFVKFTTFYTLPLLAPYIVQHALVPVAVTIFHALSQTNSLHMVGRE